MIILNGWIIESDFEMNDLFFIYCRDSRVIKINSVREYSIG